MREIKFRAWDIEMNRYIYPELWDNKMPSNWKQHFILEQFTGLHDKNGKEIFEGDIIFYECIDEDCDTRTVTKHIEIVKSLDDYIDAMNWIPKRGEIIGNIHENHDLLETTK